MPSQSQALRDFLYFDADKSASIFSQLSGGLITAIETRAEDAQDQRNIRQYDFKLFKPEFGGVQSSSHILQESRILHHDLLARIEAELFKGGFATDISGEMTSSDVLSGAAHAKLRDSFYVRVEGWAVLEDYNRIKTYALRHNKTTEFLARCATVRLEENPDFQLLQQQLNAQKERVASISDRNKRVKEERALKQAEQTFQKMVREISGLSEIAPWFLEGVDEFIETFMPNRINLRVYPFPELPAFQVIANLRKSCFVDADLENLLFAYGSRPNVRLTMFGLITSLPEIGDTAFDPMSEFQLESSQDFGNDDLREFEKGFRGVFRGFQGFENMVRYSRYPNLTIYPIAVYRDIRSAERLASAGSDDEASILLT